MQRPLVFVALLALALAGCSEGPPPRAWAANVCSALTPWRAEITTLTSRAQEQTPNSATPEQAKDTLVRMLEGARDSSERARDKVEAAGVPEVDGGKEIAAGVIDSLRKMRDAYGRARDTIKELPTSDPTAFYDSVATAMTTLQTEYAASALDTSKFRSPELQQAFEEVPECLS
jgi:predicted lipid-binding transport protein (Tim44 family)